MLTLVLLGLFALAGCTPATFDYIIIGGGTAGITVAARLSENANTTVIVLEAGEDRSEDIKVLAPGLLTSLYGDPEYDWNHRTVPQKHANDNVVAHPRGKLLGGSSAINFMWWTHAAQQDINNWGLLGNNNWSWSAIDPFFKKSERYVTPSQETVEALDVGYIDSALHGSVGPIDNTFADIQGPLDKVWSKTYENLGLAVRSDPRDGLALGAYTNLLSMDLSTRSRSYAATTYLQDATARANFRVVTGALVQRILFDPSAEQPRGSGVQYTVNSTVRTIRANREIILSAGSFGSPQLLELSGIGDPEVLKSSGISPVVRNRNVGQNLQDHVYVPLGFVVKPGIFTQDDFGNEKFFDEAYEDYVSNRTGYLATTSGMSALLSLQQIGLHRFPAINGIIEKYCSSGGKSQNEQHELRPHRHAMLCSSIREEAVVQEFAVPAGMSPQFANDSTKLFIASTPGNFLTLAASLQHPFSHGSVHISSGNVSRYPTIDPEYLAHPLDIAILSAAALHLQEVARTPPLSDLLVDQGTENQPGYFFVDETNVEAWIRDNLQSEYHPCGTCAMLPRERGGVVDDRFRVYGVDGLRVVDASIFPMIPRANLQSLVYAIAERASDFIKEDQV